MPKKFKLTLIIEDTPPDGCLPYTAEGLVREMQKNLLILDRIVGLRLQ